MGPCIILNNIFEKYMNVDFLIVILGKCSIIILGINIILFFEKCVHGNADCLILLIH
jgi:hypothetical protein